MSLNVYNTGERGMDMALKPSPVQAALLDELIGGATSNGKYEQFEKEELQEFQQQLNRHADP